MKKNNEVPTLDTSEVLGSVDCKIAAPTVRLTKSGRLEVACVCVLFSWSDLLQRPNENQSELEKKSVHCGSIKYSNDLQDVQAWSTLACLNRAASMMTSRYND